MMSTGRPLNPIAPARCQMAGKRAQLEILLVLLVIAIAPATAQTFGALHKFSGAGDGGFPPASVIRDARGNLYGVAAIGGAFDYGVVFKLDRAGKESVLHSFAAADGSDPEAGLIQDSEGNLYGTTSYGGTSEGGACRHGCGTVFKIDKAGKETVLYAFTGKEDGGIPTTALIRDGAGNFYGTTDYGGIPCVYGCGVVFKLDKSGKETVLYSFKGGTDGASPSSALVMDASGNLYGTTSYGGDPTCRCGVVFKLDKRGKETVLHRFTGDPDGYFPNGLVQDGAGNFYGITSVGGMFSCYVGNCGIVFMLDRSHKETILYAFTGGADGAHPSSLIRDSAGNLYGATTGGGNTQNECDPDGCGTIFKLDTGGKLTVLHTFEGPDGFYPIGLTMDATGNFYGASVVGGKPGCGGYGCGVIFKLTP